MLTNLELENLFIFDIETVPQYKSFEELEKNNELLADVWKNKFSLRFTKDGSLTYEEAYLEKAALYPEFGKIICVSFGKIFENGEIKLHNISIKDNDFDENKFLIKVANIFRKNTDRSLSGFNIVNFDIPYLYKKFIMYDINIPNQFKVQNLKPWEYKFYDLMKYYMFNSYDMISLNLLCVSLGIESPKELMDGKDVYDYYFNKKDLTKIGEYCNKDVEAVAKIFIKLSKL